MPTAADIRIKNEKFQAKAGTRQPAKKSSVDKKQKVQETATARYTKIAALGLLGLLAAGFFLEVFKLLLKLF